jgi:DNA-directed RNA polymerase specialized sigma24 family protein
MTEPPGFREFVRARQDVLLRAAWLLAADWHEAEDLLQTALVKVWPRWESIVSRGDAEAYVRRTLVTTFLHALPGRHREGRSGHLHLSQRAGIHAAVRVERVRDSFQRGHRAADSKRPNTAWSLARANANLLQARSQRPFRQAEVMSARVDAAL